ncbi:hypothetical protein GCM10010428_42130 [Actinosynnema pretiosum subsp. pretiosum]
MLPVVSASSTRSGFGGTAGVVTFFATWALWPGPSTTSTSEGTTCAEAGGAALTAVVVAAHRANARTAVLRTGPRFPELRGKSGGGPYEDLATGMGEPFREHCSRSAGTSGGIIEAVREGGNYLEV